jgi:hypothetical protein
VVILHRKSKNIEDMSTKKSEQEDKKVVRIIKLAAELIVSIIEAVEDTKNINSALKRRS